MIKVLEEARPPDWRRVLLIKFSLLKDHAITCARCREIVGGDGTHICMGMKRG